MSQVPASSHKLDPKMITGIILAAGQGKRMGGSLPKVLHPIHGKAMLYHVIHSVESAGVGTVCLVLQENLEPYQDFLNLNKDKTVCVQSIRNGTGAAAAIAGYAMTGITVPAYAKGKHKHGPEISHNEYCLICTGDTPALNPQSLKEFIQLTLDSKWDISVCGMEVPDPKGYGRLIGAKNQKLDAIIEEKDADPKTLKIRHCNSGIFFAKTKILFELLHKISNKNNQEEYYLTDCIALANARGYKVGYYLANDWKNFLGVNTPEQLEFLKEVMLHKDHPLSQETL